MSETPEDIIREAFKWGSACHAQAGCQVCAGLADDPDSRCVFSDADAALASLRQRQEELEAENERLSAVAQYKSSPLVRGVAAEQGIASLRTQLQQTEQERDAHHKRASDNAKRASEAEHRERVLTAQLQQTETALRAWLEFHSRRHTPDELFEMADMTHTVLAALAAPPANTKENDDDDAHS